MLFALLKPKSFFCQAVKTSPNTAIIIAVVVLALIVMSTVTGVWLVKKYVCGGRSVHTHTHMLVYCQHVSQQVKMSACFYFETHV